MSKHIRSAGLPDEVRNDLIRTRKRKGWSQSELGQRSGLPQMHISQIETGKRTPRVDTLLNLLRLLDLDLLVVPRSLVPLVQALIRDHAAANSDSGEEAPRPLYTLDDADDADSEERPR